MKKTTAVIIIVIVVLFFGGLVYYAFLHRRGAPVRTKPEKRVVLNAPYVEKKLDLKEGISSEIWETIPGQKIRMVQQVMILPWGTSLISPVEVKAFHDKKDVYIYMTWADTMENRTISPNVFSDACAVMFPLDEKVQPATIMMGFMGKVNIWHWKASQDREYWVVDSEEEKSYADFYYPYEDTETLSVSKTPVTSAVNDLIAVRIASLSRKPDQNVHGRGVWSDGKWQVVFKRSMMIPDRDNLAREIVPDKMMLCSFAVWNGQNGDRGGKKSIANWVELNLK